MLGHAGQPTKARYAVDRALSERGHPGMSKAMASGNIADCQYRNCTNRVGSNTKCNGLSLDG